MANPKVVVHLVRHGEKHESGRHRGKLTQKGLGQGVTVGENLGKKLARSKKPIILKFYASPVGRIIKFTGGIRKGLDSELRKTENRVTVLGPVRQRERYKHVQIHDEQYYNAMTKGKTTGEIDFEWLAGEYRSDKIEEPVKVLARIRKWTEEFASRISRRYAGEDVEIHLVVATHGDILEAVREHITGKPIRRSDQLAQFAEQIRIEIEGGKGTYYSRKDSRSFRPYKGNPTPKARSVASRPAKKKKQSRRRVK